MVATLYETILANARHAASNNDPVDIGGGFFTGAEMAEVARMAVSAADLLGVVELLLSECRDETFVPRGLSKSQAEALNGAILLGKAAIAKARGI